MLRLTQVIDNHSKRTPRYPFPFNFSIGPDTRSFALAVVASIVIVISITSPLVNLRQKNHRQIEFNFFHSHVREELPILLSILSTVALFSIIIPPMRIPFLPPFNRRVSIPQSTIFTYIG